MNTLQDSKTEDPKKVKALAALAMAKEKRQRRVYDAISKHLRKGTVATNLEKVAKCANYYRLDVSRQTLHHWYHGALPKRDLLEGYIARLEELQTTALTEEQEKEVKSLLAFFNSIKEAAYHE